jgi:hypothetical protein
MIHQAEKVLQVEQPTGEIDLLRDEFNNRDQRVPDVIYEPTMTSDPNRPRTVAARYWRDERVMEVSWRDGGTPYNYYEVSPADWRRFTTSRSPGKLINRFFNSKPYGPA